MRRNEEISDRRKDGQESLQPARRPKSLHGPLSFSQRQMRVLGAIVQALMRSMLDCRHDLASCRTIGAKLVSDDALWKASLLFHQPHQETLGSRGVTSALDDLIENISVLIDRAPQPVLSPANRHNHFVEMPHIIGAWRFPPQTSSIIRTELLRPTPDCHRKRRYRAPTATLPPAAGSTEIGCIARPRARSQMVGSDDACK